jgi:hypothetical protein
MRVKEAKDVRYPDALIEDLDKTGQIRLIRGLKDNENQAVEAAIAQRAFTLEDSLELCRRMNVSQSRQARESPEGSPSLGNSGHIIAISSGYAFPIPGNTSSALRDPSIQGENRLGPATPLAERNCRLAQPA